MGLALEPAWDMLSAEPLRPEPDFAALLGPAAWRRLHPDIRRRFAGHRSATPVIYDGCLEVRRSPGGLIFALLAKPFGGPLPIRQCAAAASLVQVRPNGQGGLVWERWIRFPGRGRSCCVRSVKRMAADGALLECVDGGLGMALSVFEDEGALVFESRNYFLEIAGVRVTLPDFLTPGRCRVCHRAAGPGRFRFSLSMDHPFLGRSISQTGIFHDPETPP